MVVRRDCTFETLRSVQSHEGAGGMMMSNNLGNVLKDKHTIKKHQA